MFYRLSFGLDITGSIPLNKSIKTAKMTVVGGVGGQRYRQTLYMCNFVVAIVLLGLLRLTIDSLFILNVHVCLCPACRGNDFVKRIEQLWKYAI